MTIPETYKIPESVLVVVYAATGHILVMRRADLPDFWQSVTGSLDPGERPAATAVRELFEETGLTTTVSRADTLDAYLAECDAEALLNVPTSGASTSGASTADAAAVDALPVNAEFGSLAPRTSEAGQLTLKLFNCQTTNQYPIRSVWRRRYAPGVTHNTEHVFLARLPETLAITLAAAEHTAFEWLAPNDALERLSSPTNRAAVTQWVLGHEQDR